MRVIKFPGLRFGHTIYSYLQLDSTQDKARELSKEISNQGLVVCAQIQTKGRGRGDKNWISQPGGLYFSIIYRSPVPIIEVKDFTKKLAIYIKSAIEKLISSVYPINLEVRGINDLYLNRKKLVGIIVETESYGLSKVIPSNAYIIGIGVNVNQKRLPKEVQDIATSFLIETDQRFSRLQIMKAICEELSVKLC